MQKIAVPRTQVLLNKMAGNTAFTDSLKFIQNIMDISVEIFHSLPCLRLLFIDRKYDSIFEVVQQNFSEQFYWSTVVTFFSV